MKRDHAFNVECATQWGVSEAVMLHHITYWVSKNSANGRHIHGGRAWTYNSYTAFTTLHPYWSKSQVARLLTKLEELGLIQSSQMLKGEWNRVKWYTVLPPVREVYGMPDWDRETPEMFEGSEVETSKERNRAVEESESCVLPYTVKRQQIPKVVLPWDDDLFAQIWDEWKHDRKERGLKQYTVRGEQATLKKLAKESGGSLTTAIEMIQNSIANGWQGIFAIKQEHSHKVRGGVATTGIDIDRIKSWATQSEQGDG